MENSQGTEIYGRVRIPERPLCEAVKVKPQLLGRLVYLRWQDHGTCTSMGCRHGTEPDNLCMLKSAELKL